MAPFHDPPARRRRPLDDPRQQESIMAAPAASATPVQPKVDLYSDTGTRPTAAMRRAIAEAEVGNEQAHEDPTVNRSEEHTSELQSLMRISYAVFCLKKK